MKVLITDLARDHKLNSDQLVTYATTYKNRYELFDYDLRNMMNTKTNTFYSDQLIKDFRYDNRKGHDWRERVNENIMITDPALAQQYNKGQTMLVQKDQLIVQLQQKINKLNKDKMKIEKEMNKVQQAAIKTDSMQQKEEGQGPVEQTVEVTGTPIGQQTSESLLIKIDNNSINIEIDQLADQLAYLQNNDLNPEKIEDITNQLNGMVDKTEKDSRFSDEIDQSNDEVIYDDYNEDEENNELIEEIEDEEKRFTGIMGTTQDNYELDSIGKPKRKYTNKEKNWYPKTRNRKQKAWSNTRIEKYESLEAEISDLKEQIGYIEDDIQSTMDQFESPSFNGVEEEMEEFWGHLTHDQREVLNTGSYKNDKERLNALIKYGAENPKDILNNYYYYYPEYDENVQKQKKQSEKEVNQQRKEIEKLKSKLEKKEGRLDKQGYPRYMDENFNNPMSISNFYDLSEAYVEDEGNINRSKEEYIDDDYVFYLKVTDGEDWFIGKVFKINPDGEWYGIVKAGDNDSFERMSYDTSYDELNIVKFLEEQYDTVDIIDDHEYNMYTEEYKDEKDELEETWPSNIL